MAKKITRVRGVKNDFNQLLRIFKCKYSSLKQNVEFFIGFVLLKLFINPKRSEDFEGIGMITLKKRNGRYQLTIDLDDFWQGLLTGDVNKLRESLSTFVKKRFNDGTEQTEIK